MDDQALQDYFGFDENDLAANRNGEYSANQARKIATEYKATSRDGLMLGIPTAALACILLFVNIVFFKKLGSDAIATVVFMLVCAGLGYYGLRSAYIISKVGFSKFVVKKVTGPIRIERGHSGLGFVFIGEEQFDIDEKLAGSMKDGDFYAFYIDSRDNAVLSVEEIARE